MSRIGNAKIVMIKAGGGGMPADPNIVVFNNSACSKKPEDLWNEGELCYHTMANATSYFNS